MNTQKITPKDRKNIVARVKAGERQKDLASEYGVSEGLISRVIKQSKPAKPEPSAPRAKDMSNMTTEQLSNRYKQCHKELLEHNQELVSRVQEAMGLRERIKVEASKSAGLRDDSWLRAQQKRLAWCEDTGRIAFSMSLLHQEVSAILHTLSKRGDPVPWSDTVMSLSSVASRAKTRIEK